MPSNELDQKRLKAIGRTLGAWLRDGNDSATLDGRLMPAHPELHYRYTEEWRGWVELRDDAANRQQDEIEEQAWTIWKAMHE